FPPPPRQETGDQVGRDECSPPALDLADVGLLVLAAELQAVRVAANDHMAQRHGRESPTVGQPSREAAVEFQRTLTTLDSPTRTQGQPARDQADDGRGSGPAITEHSGHQTISSPAADRNVCPTGPDRLPSGKVAPARLSKDNSLVLSNLALPLLR